MPQKQSQIWLQNVKGFYDVLSALEEATNHLHEYDYVPADPENLIRTLDEAFVMAVEIIQSYFLFTEFASKQGGRGMVLQIAQDYAIDPYAWQELVAARSMMNNARNSGYSTDELYDMALEFIPVLYIFRGELKRLEAAVSRLQIQTNPTGQL